MTTSTNELEQNEDKPKERSINELLDLPYSEMTDEEIERVVQFKADVQTRDNLHNAQMQAISDTLMQAAQANLEVAQAATEQLNQLTAHAIARFENESQ